MDWLSSLQNPEKLHMSGDLLRIFENASESFVKFWAIIATVAEEDEAPIDEITTEVFTIFGDILYEIALDTFSGDEDKILKFRWMDQPLPYWNKMQQEKGHHIDNLLGLLEDPDWKVFIEEKMADDKKRNNGFIPCRSFFS